MPAVTELVHAFADLAEAFNRNPFGAVIVLLLACGRWLARGERDRGCPACLDTDTQHGELPVGER